VLRNLGIAFMCLFIQANAFAYGPVPVELLEIENELRTQVLKKFIMQVHSETDDTTYYYSNVYSVVGKYGSGWGDFNFTAQIHVSNSRIFSCRASVRGAAGQNENITISQAYPLCSEILRQE